jgi:hypothetical protein
MELQIAAIIEVKAANRRIASALAWKWKCQYRKMVGFVRIQMALVWCVLILCSFVAPGCISFVHTLTSSIVPAWSDGTSLMSATRYALSVIGAVGQQLELARNRFYTHIITW